MAQFVCKMCGVSIQSSSSGVVSCPHCGLPQTQPRLDNPEHNELYIQANTLRQEKNFKEAQVMFQKLLVDHPEDAELNWSVALCRYGISYGIDPLAGKPVHIISTPRKTRFVEDEHYKTALRCANNAQWPCYADEGTAIDIRIADEAERPGKKKQQQVFGTAKVGDRGQIVIPKEAREFFGIEPGDTLLILGKSETGLIVTKPDTLNDLASQIFQTVEKED